MAAGDVSIHGHSGRAIRGKKIVFGQVTLDGGNPTPVALAGYLSEVEGAVLTNETSSAPGDDPVEFTFAVSGTTLNVYAWKHDGTDPTLVASTNNAAIINFIAWGKP